MCKSSLTICMHNPITILSTLLGEDDSQRLLAEDQKERDRSAPQASQRDARLRGHVEQQ